MLFFTEGKAATTIEFDGPLKDPAPPDMFTELGQQQDAAITKGLSASLRGIAGAFTSADLSKSARRRPAHGSFLTNDAYLQCWEGHVG